MKLYEITDDLRAVSDLVESGEATVEQIEDTMQGLQGMFEEKAVAVFRVLRNFDSDSEAIKAEIDRLQDLQKAKAAAKASLVDYLKLNMVRSGIKKISSPICNITLLDPPAVAEVYDEAALPEEMVVTTIIKKADKRKILMRLKDGEEIPGARLGEGNYGLRIK
jgi:hypothetical protein